MNVRAHLLVPPHFFVSTAFKKMRWKDEFGKWLPKLPQGGGCILAAGAPALDVVWWWSWASAVLIRHTPPL